jgi:hypothetical protein
MPFLTVNGITLPVTVGSASGALVEIAEAKATMQNKPRKERQSLLGEFSVDLFKLTNAEASFIEVVLEGLFHRVPFDNDDNSTDGYLNSGTSSIINSANAKTGHGYAEGNTYTYTWPFELRADPNAWWSLMYWRSTQATPTVWDHFIVNSDGTQYKNGALEGSPTSLPELSIGVDGSVTLAASSTTQYDELVVFLAPVATATQASEIYTWLNAGNAWPDPPECVVSGTIVDDEPLTAIAEVRGEDYVQGGLTAGWTNNIRRMTVNFMQSRERIGLRIASADAGWILDASRYIVGEGFDSGFDSGFG